MKFGNTAYSKALVYMHLSVLLWGLTGVLGRGIDLTEGVLVTYRLVFTSITLAIYAFAIKKLKLPPFKDLRQMFWIGILVTIHWLLFYGAIKYSNVSITLSMLASQGIFTVLFERLLLKKPFAISEVFFGLVAMFGIWIIYSNESVFGVGIFLALMASVVGSLFNVFNKPVVEKHDPIMVSFVEIFSGVVGLLIFMPFYISFFDVQKLVPNTQDILLLLILAFFCTHLTLIFSLKALRYLDAFTLNLSINLEPIYGIALAFFIFEEHKFLSPQFFMGAGLILLSVVVHGYFQSKKVRVIEP